MSTDHSRYDLYGNFRLRLAWNGIHVAAFSKVSGLSRGAEPAHRAGGHPVKPRVVPGQTTYTAIVLERGVTHDVVFSQWMNKVWDTRLHSGEPATNDFRKDLSLELYSEAGMLVLAYALFRCWPSEFAGMPELDATGNATVIQTLVLQSEGWEIDPRYSDPARNPDKPGLPS